MNRKEAEKMIEKYQQLADRFIKKSEIAGERYVDTSYGKIRVLEYGFDDPEEKPLFVDIHGGGWALMAPEFDEEMNLRILEKANVKIISMDYPRAPQNPFPEGMEATYEVIKHYADNAKEYGIDPDNIGVGGYSSGGNFATVACFMAKERGDFNIKYQFLGYPGTDAAGDPYKKPKCTEGLTNELIEALVLCYLPDKEKATSPYASPVYASKELLTGLPPALLILAGKGDPLNPEGRLYGKKLEEAGVPLEMYEFRGTLHGFMQEDNPDAEEAIRIMTDFIRSKTQ